MLNVSQIKEVSLDNSIKLSYYHLVRDTGLCMYVSVQQVSLSDYKDYIC